MCVTITEGKMHTLYIKEKLHILKEISDHEWAIKKRKACLEAWTTQGKLYSVDY